MCIYGAHMYLCIPNMKFLCLTLCQGEVCTYDDNTNTDTNDEPKKPPTLKMPSHFSIFPKPHFWPKNDSYRSPDPKYEPEGEGLPPPPQKHKLPNQHSIHVLCEFICKLAAILISCVIFTRKLYIWIICL